MIAHADGSPAQPTYVSQQWDRLTAKTPSPGLRFHDLGHAHTTHLLAYGFTPRWSASGLGPQQVGITLDLDSHRHVILGMQEDETTWRTLMLPSKMPFATEEIRMVAIR